MRDKLSAAPQALICMKCFQRTEQGADEFYCEHNSVWAIRRPGGGWILSTEVSPEDHRALLEDARRLQGLEEPASSTPTMALRVH